MYASPSHRCRGLDKNDGGALNLCVLRPRVATVANWQLQLGGGELQMCEGDRERGEQEKVLKLVAPTKSLPCTCVASLSVSAPFPAVPVPVPVYHLKSCSGDKKLYCRVHNLRDLHAKERKRSMRKTPCPVSFTSIRREREQQFLTFIVFNSHGGCGLWAGLEYVCLVVVAAPLRR